MKSLVPQKPTNFICKRKYSENAILIFHLNVFFSPTDEDDDDEDDEDFEDDDEWED